MVRPNGTKSWVYHYLSPTQSKKTYWADYLDALREGRDTAEFRADAQTQANPTTQLQALIDQLGEDKVLELLKGES